MPYGSTPAIMLQEAHELGRKQDAKLHRLLTVATTAPVVMLSAGTFAVAVDDALAASAAVIVFGSTILLGLILLFIEGVAADWNEGPDLDELLKARPRNPDRLRVGLVRSFTRDHARNRVILARVKSLVVGQAVTMGTTFSILLLGFHELA